MLDGMITKFAREAIFSEEYISEKESLEFLTNIENFMTISKGIIRELERSGLSGSVDELYKILRLKMREQGVAPADATIKSWLMKNILPSRPFAIKICFALELTLESAVTFLNRACFQSGFSPRIAEEVIFYYCLKFGKPYSHAQYLYKLFKESDGSLSEEQIKGTQFIKNEQDQLQNNDTALINWLALRKSSFTEKSETAFNWYSLLKREVVDAIRSSPGFSDIDKENLESDIDVEEKDISYEKLLYYLYLDIPVVMRGTKKPEADFVSLKDSVISDILTGIPLPEQLKKIERREVSVDRKTLMTLFFFRCSFNDFADYESPYDYFYDNMNEILDDCNMGLLYPPNPFDWLILKSVNSLEVGGENSVVYFNEILKLSFGDEYE